MGHGTVGYCFEGDPELGGQGYLIGLHRCQSFKVMPRKVHEQTVNAETSTRSSKGNAVKYSRGDLVMTDSIVTGSTYGTASKPKFPLKELWTTVLLPALDALVEPGGLSTKKTTPDPILIKCTRHGYKSSSMCVGENSSIRHHRALTLTVEFGFLD